METTKDNGSYLSRQTWSPARPRVMVIACSDGRLQESIDDFLSHHLGILHYDRLYAPGGPGALADSGSEFLRADQFRRECVFLLRAHELERIILIFHGAAEDGPEEATCADYRRKLPRRTPAEIRDQMKTDMDDLRRTVFGGSVSVQLHVYRAEVTQDGRVRFVDLDAN